MKLRIYRIFPYQVGLDAVLWPLILFLHLHLSGWGTTLYIPIDPTPFKSWPWFNLYNIPLEQCTNAWFFGPEWLRIGSCSYPLTNLMHGVGLVLLALTVSLFTQQLAIWAVAFWTYVPATVAALAWEKWELLKGITILNPADFSTVAQVTSEGMRLLNDTVDDVLVGVIFLAIGLSIILLLDRYFGYEYVDA